MLELLFIFIIFASIVAMLLLCFWSFNAPLVLSAATLFTLVFTYFFKQRTPIRISRGMWMILALACVFRAEPYRYVIGGTDPGVYTYMAAHFADGGGPLVEDTVWKAAVENGVSDTFLKSVQYDFFDRTSAGLGPIHTPGIYVGNSVTHQNIFQFFPLHAAWMALFSFFVGKHNMEYSLVFFSLLSILGLMLIVRDIFKDTTASIFVGLLVALNPLQAYISKLPVAETAAFNFLIWGIYFVAKFYFTDEETVKKKNYSWLFISCGLFLCLFHTRVSGFVHLPLAIAAGIAVATQPASSKRNGIIFWAIGVMLSYAISVCYGMSYSNFYTIETLNGAFIERIGQHWPIIFAVILSLIGIFWLSLYFASLSFRVKVGRFLTQAAKTLPYLIIFTVIATLLKAILLGYTDRYASYEPYTKWDMVHHGMESVRYTGIYILSAYTAHIGFVLLFYFLYLARKKSDLRTSALLYVFFLAFFYGVSMNFEIPFQYYFARYLLEGSMPFLFVIIALTLSEIYSRPGSRWYKRVAILLLAIILIPGARTTAFQLRGTTGKGAESSLDEIARVVSQKDLLLIKICESPSFVIDGPLEFYYHLHVLHYHQNNDLEGELKKLAVSPQYPNTYILDRNENNQPYLHLVSVIDYHWEMMRRTQKAPKDFVQEGNRWYLYSVEKNKLNLFAPVVKK